MAFNLVHAVSSFLTPEAVARFANAIGVNPALAQTLINAALPTVLASLGGGAATPAGAQRLSDQIAAQDPGVLDNLAATFGAGHGGLATSGSSMLSSLLGGAGLSGVAGALSRLTGAQAGQAESALGLLTPVALSAIGRQDPSLWNSGQALGSMFASQRDLIQNAMPAGLGAALGGLGLPALSAFAAPARAAASVDRAAQATGAAMRETASKTADAGRAAAREAERAAAAGTPGWLIPALAIAALAAAAWWFLGRSPEPAPAPAPRPAATAPATTAPATTVPPAPAQQATPAQTPAPDVAGTASNVATATVGSIQQALAGITDAASARAAEAKLREAAAQVDKASGAIAAMPEAVRKTVASNARPAVARLQEQVTKALAIPGVSDVLKPILDPMMTKLNAIAGV